MKLLLIDGDSDTLAQAQKLGAAAGYHVTTVQHHDLNRINPVGWDLIMLTGGFWHINEGQSEHMRAYHNEIELIRKSTVPIVGICHGMQIMVMAYAGKVTRFEEPEYGSRQISLTTAGQKLLGLPERITVFKNHTRAVQSLPAEFELLGKSPAHAEIIRHRNRPIVGVQFHPEIQQPGVDSVAMLKRLIEIARTNAIHSETTAELA